MRKGLSLILVWYAAFSKRLLKKPLFLAVLLCAVLLPAAAALASREDHGMVTVALWAEGGAGEALKRELLAERTALRFLSADSAEAAREAVALGRADAAWLLRADLSAAAAAYAEGGADCAAVTVVERENNVFLALAREKLFAALYPEVCRAEYRSFVRRAAPDASARPEDWLRDYGAKQPLLRVESVEGAPQAAGGEYMLAPVRGLLAILAMLGGLSSALWYLRAEEEELFVRLSAGARRRLPLAAHLAALVPLLCAAGAALALSGLWTSLRRELLLALLLAVSGAAFCELLRRLCRSERTLGVLTPLLLLLMTVLCPVFLRFRLAAPLSWLLPPTYYIHAAASDRYLLYFAAYTAALLALLALSGALRRDTTWRQIRDKRGENRKAPLGK